jgi:ABC-type phosphate/phosphonate transport system substrate-binding protein
LFYAWESAAQNVVKKAKKAKGEIKMKRFTLVFITTIMLLGLSVPAFSAEDITCWFPPGWQPQADKARAIAQALGDLSGLQIRPRIAKSYPEILSAFSTDQQSLVYVGSFVQALIKARGLGTPLAQAVDGKEFYAGILVYPKGGDPAAILRNNPAEIVYAVAASSGESSAKAATGGKASMGVANHGAACAAVVAGKAKAGVIKNWWWESNKSKFPSLDVYEIPNVSLKKNPDHVLTASRAMSAKTMKKIAAAAFNSKDAFGTKEMKPFDSNMLDFSLSLMRKGKIDPITYTW